MKYPILAALATLLSTPALAGPPYLNDDPVPTDTGHWEIYVFTAGDERGSTLDADSGFDLNFGPVKNVQVSSTLPMSFSHDPSSGWRVATGDVELAVKWRLIDDDKDGVSAAVFPRAFLPTSGLKSHKRTHFLLPIWIEKDFAGGTSIFGGGGYEINPGPANRDFWQGGLAITHDLNKKLSLGAEIAWQGSDTIGGAAQTSAGIGSIFKLSDHYALLFSGGPTFSDDRTSYHFYGALGLFF